MRSRRVIYDGRVSKAICRTNRRTAGKRRKTAKNRDSLLFHRCLYARILPFGNPAYYSQSSKGISSKTHPGAQEAEEEPACCEALATSIYRATTSRSGSIDLSIFWIPRSVPEIELGQVPQAP